LPEVILLRHAEKPDDEQSPELAHRGRVRAAALSEYLPHHFGAPTFLLAARASPVSNRPVLTLKPLSEALTIPIDTRYQADEYELLAQEITSQTRFYNARVIICWHHGKIPELTRALTVREPPRRWDDDVFDLIWHIKDIPGEAKLSLINQKLLFGDRA
jgi:broad specificity phosphatase PhoE